MVEQYTLQNAICSYPIQVYRQQCTNEGALYCLDSKIHIKNSSFTGNSTQNGGVLYNKQTATEATNSTLHEYLIHTSTSNMELLLRSSIACIRSNFSRNTATSNGVIFSGTCSGSCIL